MAPAPSGSRTRARLSFRSEVGANPNGTGSLHDRIAALREHTIRAARAEDHLRASALFVAHLPSRADEPERWREEDAKGSREPSLSRSTRIRRDDAHGSTRAGRVGFSGPAGTGVRRSDRDHGIATALKVRWISLARDRGVAVMKSSSGNPAMLRVNEKLGYRRTWTEVRLVRRLRSLSS